MQPESPLSLHLVLSGRDLTEPKLSPDGSSLAFVQRWRGASSVQEVSVHGDLPERTLSFGTEPAAGRAFGGGCFSWLPSGEGIVHVGRDGELWRVSGSALDRLTEHGRQCRAPTMQTSMSKAEALLAYAVDDAEIWLMDMSTGSSRRLDDGRHGFCFDPAIAPDGSVVSWQGWSAPYMPWDGSERVDCHLVDGHLESWRPPHGAVQQPRFSPDGSRTCAHDESGWLNIYVGGRPVFAEHFEQAGPTWGMGQRSYAVLADGSVVYERNDRGFGVLCMAMSPHGSVGTSTVLDVEFVGVHGHLTAAGNHVALLRSGPTTPPEIVILATSDNPDVSEWTVATSGVKAWEGIDAPAPERIELEEKGLTLHARRFRSSVGSDGRMLCWIHGGPTDQWRIDFRPRITYWTSRGWDVLVVDPRGSTGHGREYQRALNGAWGRVDVNDAVAFIRHAHDEGWASPESTVVVGGSSGGLTVLAVLADHPALVAGGVASYPVSDLSTLADPTYRFEAHYTDTLVGPPDDEELYRKLSPINRADRIAGPLLLFHGTDDPAVPFAQSELLVERIRSSGGEVDFVAYEGEGHGFRDAANQQDEYDRTERFLNSIRIRS